MKTRMNQRRNTSKAEGTGSAMLDLLDPIPEAPFPDLAKGWDEAFAELEKAWEDPFAEVERNWEDPFGVLNLENSFDGTEAAFAEWDFP